MSTTMKKSEMLAATKADVVAKLPLEEIAPFRLALVFGRFPAL